ncbi:MAG: hypothetical protein ACWGN1_04595, partial [Desulfobulbales bacterium]
RTFLFDLLKGSKSERCTQFSVVKDIIASSGGFDYARQFAKKLISTGITGLDIFSAPKNKKITDILTGLAHYVIQRER